MTATVNEVECRPLARALSNVDRFTFMASDNPALGRVHVRRRGQRLILSATDRFAMIHHTLTLKDTDGDEFDCVIEAGMLAPIEAAAREQAGDAVLTFERHSAGPNGGPSLEDGTPLPIGVDALTATFGTGPRVIVPTLPATDWPGTDWTDGADQLWPTKFVPCTSFHLGIPQLARLAKVIETEHPYDGVTGWGHIKIESSNSAGIGALVITVSDDVQILQMPVRP